jgi:hypothetical protein
MDFVARVDNMDTGFARFTKNWYYGRFSTENSIFEIVITETS